MNPKQQCIDCKVDDITWGVVLTRPMPMHEETSLSKSVAPWRNLCHSTDDGRRRVEAVAFRHTFDTLGNPRNTMRHVGKPLVPQDKNTGSNCNRLNRPHDCIEPSTPNHRILSPSKLALALPHSTP